MKSNTYFILTLGCQMNVTDSQRIETKLKELGYKSAPEKDADLVVVNSCSVRQKGIDRIWGGIKKWKNANKKILITGCVLETDRKKYAERGIPFLHINDLPKIDKNLKIDNKTDKNHYLEIMPELKGDIAYIPIMTGCNNFCSYCAVPYTRGREVSRKADDILAEVKLALQKGFKEIWLLGQNVNSYGIIKNVKIPASPAGGKNQNNNSKFISLLEEVDALPGDFKFNFISSNPQDMGEELINCFAGLKKWTRELHLAMQSGNDEILRKMNRKCTSAQFLKLVDNLKLKIDNLKLSTDIIVGFPGETKNQFEHTRKVCLEVVLYKAYVNQYSPRSGTVSAKMIDDVPATEKKRRWKILDNLINK